MGGSSIIDRSPVRSTGSPMTPPAWATGITATKREKRAVRAAAMQYTGETLLSTPMDDPVPASVPCVPSPLEAELYLHPMKFLMLARTSAEIWTPPIGPEPSLEPKEVTPFDPRHPLYILWEDDVADAIDSYLVQRPERINGALCSWTLKLLCLGTAGQPSTPVVMIGVSHGFLSPNACLETAIYCRNILLNRRFDDVHIIIHESSYGLQAGAPLYKPTNDFDPLAAVREPWSSTLPLGVCNAETQHLQGTGGIFFTDCQRPGKLFLLTSRHALLNPKTEPNMLYRFHGEHSGEKKRHVMLMGKTIFDDRYNAILSAHEGELLRIKRLEDVLCDFQDEARAVPIREELEFDLKRAKSTATALKVLSEDVKRDWEDEAKRVIGHIILAPPITFGYDEDESIDNGFTEDWAVVEMCSSKLSKLNFVGNAMDLGDTPAQTLTEWMYPSRKNPSSFKYPSDGILRFFGKVSDSEMLKLNVKTFDHNSDFAMMVLKNGINTHLTVGRLTATRAVTRIYTKELQGRSKEILVLPRDSKSGPFSDVGDSGSAVVDGQGRICGLLTGGDPQVLSGFTYVTSINFLLKRLASYGIAANIFPTAEDLLA
jgi:hypothetical protein